MSWICQPSIHLPLSLNLPRRLPPALLSCPRRIGSLGALPAAGSKVFGSGRLNQMQIAIRHAAPLQEGQFGLYGELNLVELQGELTPKLQSTPIR